MSHGLDFANAKSVEIKYEKETALAGSNPCGIIFLRGVESLLRAKGGKDEKNNFMDSCVIYYFEHSLC